MVDKTELLGCYRAMVTARAIEEECMRQSGHWYAGVGEEATAVGAYWRARPTDVCYPHYRCSLVVHWMRGRSLEDIYLSALSRKGASSEGRHAAGFDGWLLGNVMPYVSVMLGPNIAFGAGTGWALKRRSSSDVAFVGFGDGTAGTGDFHETLNLAAVLELPVVFICQNNQFSISTRTRKALAGDSIASWADRYDMPTAIVDGNDVVAVLDAVGEATEHARSRRGPSLVECRTYRRTGHFAADAADYRDSAETAAWAEKDPIAGLARRLVKEWGVPGDELEAVAESARRAVDEGAARAASGPHFTADDLDPEGVYEHELRR